MDGWLLRLGIAFPLAALAGIGCVAIAQTYAGYIARGDPVDGLTLQRALCKALGPKGWTPVSSPAAAPCALLLVAASLPFVLAPGLLSLARLCACMILLLLALIDLRTRLLPDALTLPLLWAGLLVSWAGFGVGLHDAVLGAALGYGVLRMSGALFELLRGAPGMGGGDMKLLAALGAWVGWQVLALLLFAACISGLLGVLAFGRGGIWRQSFAFGPHLAGAGAAVLAAPPVVQYFFI